MIEHFLLIFKVGFEETELFFYFISSTTEQVYMKALELSE